MGLYKRFLLRGVLAGAIITTLVGAGAILLNTQHTQAGTARDCKPNSILWGGALTPGELINRYENDGLDKGDVSHCPDNAGLAYGDIKAVYNSFGITSTGIHSLSTKAAMGQVHKDGTVWLNGEQIGTGAMTAGRDNFPGSTPIPGTQAFMRPPSVSFGSQSLDAYIGYENGEPAWAILTSCGNPVKFERAHIAIAKQVQNPQGVFGEDATFQNGDHMRYLLKVTNTGQVTANNVMVADLVPAGETYDKGTTKVRGTAFKDGVNSFSGINIGSLAPGATANVTFTATASEPDTKCGGTPLINLAAASADTLNAVSDTAKSKINVNCVAKCSALTADSYDVEVGKKLSFTAAIDTKGVKATSFVFKVDGNVAQNSTKKTYDFTSNAPGTHSVSVTVHFSDGTKDGGDGSCAKKVTVKQKPPVISCDSLTADVDLTKVQPGEQVVFTAKGTAIRANINSFDFTVNGVSEQNVKSNVFTFSRTQPGTYTVSVTVRTDHGDATSDKCTKQVTVQTPPAISCVSLSADKTQVQPGEQIVFTATGSATPPAKILSYNFTVNGVSQPNTGSNVFDFTSNQEEGTFTVSVTVHTDHGDATSDACTKQVTVKKVVSPIPSCDLLSVDKTSINVGDSITATVNFTAPSGTSFQQAHLLFGDESDTSQTTDTNQLDANGHVTTTHTYNAVGDYNLSVTLDFMVNTQAKNGVTGAKCVAKVTVGAVLPATTPTELVNTGPGDIAGIFAGATLAGAFLHRRWTLRRSAK